MAVKVRLSIVQQMAAKANATRTSSRLAATCAEADEAIESLRDFARGVYPPLLEAEGLGVALNAQTKRLSFPVMLTSDLERRHSRNVEATVYFCLVETFTALDRVERLRDVQVVVTEDGHSLTFEVTATHDPGLSEFDAPDHLLDRLEALDGSLSFDVEPTATVVRGSLPVHAPAAGRRLVADGRPDGAGMTQQGASIELLEVGQ